MGFASVARSSGAYIRAESEYNLYKSENQKRIRVNNTIAGARMAEKEGVAKEADDSSKVALDKYYDSESASDAESAAWAAFAGSIFSLASNISSSASSGASVFTGVLSALGPTFGALGALFAALGAGDEAEMLKTQAGELSKSAKADKKNIEALDGNPTL